jgi:AcrR family transcriptional regulator
MPAADRRRQLLDVAVGAFAAGGYHQTSMEDVATAAGVTKPVLYQHFRSKRALYSELLEDLAGQLQEAIGKATAAAAGPRQQVEAGFAAYFNFVDEQQDAFRILFGGGSKRDEDFAEFVQAMEQAFAEMIATLITAGHGEVHRLTLAHGIVGMAESTARRWIGAKADGTDKRDAATVANEVAQLAWAGLRGIRD